MKRHGGDRAGLIRRGLQRFVANFEQQTFVGLFDARALSITGARIQQYHHHDVCDASVVLT
ncbi:MAG: hypothetical protein WAL36_22375 [Pseudolabrys sp.]